MRWTKAELLNNKDTNIKFSDYIKFSKEYFIGNKHLRNLKDVYVDGIGYYDYSYECLEVDVNVAGVMTTMCAITNQDIDLPFEFDSHLVFSFVDNEDIDAYLLKNDVLELDPVIFQLINLEVPLKVVKDDVGEYPQGKDWRIISEEDLRTSKKDEIDPRLAKLKDFKFDDDK